MRFRLALALLLSATLAACGGGDDDDGGSPGNGGGSSAAGTTAMAGAFTTEITKIKDCFQGEVDGKGACSVNLLSDPVTGLCSDVRIGKANAQFPGADYAKFAKTCSDWSSVLSLDTAGKVTLLSKMVTELEAVK